MRVIDIVGELIEHLDLKESKDKLYRRRVEVFLDLVRSELEPMPGLRQSLSRLAGAGFKLAVASSGARRYVELVLERFEIADYFQAVVTGDDVTVGKPNPEAYLVASKKLGVSPSVCAVLEDAAKGIQSAKAAGCFCVAVRNPNIPPQDYSLADTVIDSLEDLRVEQITRLAKA
jgi:HAD superfamily hydrolase (TIGR01509 family)